MVFELIATISAGFAGYGVAALLQRLSGRRLPRALLPVAAGLAMLFVVIANEYGWYTRKLTTLPDGLQVAQTVESRSILRPWTLLKPAVSRFLAVDIKHARSHAARPDQYLVDVYAFARWYPPSRITVALDCANGRRADITDAVTVAEDGSINNAHWIDVGQADPVITATCQ